MVASSITSSDQVNVGCRDVGTAPLQILQEADLTVSEREHESREASEDNITTRCHDQELWSVKTPDSESTSSASSCSHSQAGSFWRMASVTSSADGPPS